MIDIRFEHVSKVYRIPRERAVSRPQGVFGRLASVLPHRVDFWALKDVSFDVRTGEALGIIGPNGAGKSTILKILSKITAPSQGSLAICGRIAALLEVGSGFHPELTGRENVYLSGSILGMRRREIAKKLDSIVEFAEVRKFIDVPVKRYSSGMYVRLGFSIAAHLEADILLLDEVLAVGDAAFQAKCIDRIVRLREDGRTIVFISHDLRAVQRLCKRVVLLKAGEVALSGQPDEVIAKYTSAAWTPAEAPQPARHLQPKKAQVTSLVLLDDRGCPTIEFRTGTPITLRLGYSVREQVEDASISVHFHAVDAPIEKVECEFTTKSTPEPLTLAPGRGVIEFRCGELGLQPGLYYLDGGIQQHGQPDPLDWQVRFANIHVGASKPVIGNFYSPHEWRILGNGGPEG